MVLGAGCGDILHAALGHSFATAATSDLDLALALTSWDAYRTLAAAFPRIGDSGIRFRIADVNVDLLPFGAVEDPQGVSNHRHAARRSACGLSKRSSPHRSPSYSHPR